MTASTLLIGLWWGGGEMAHLFVLMPPRRGAGAALNIYQPHNLVIYHRKNVHLSQNLSGEPERREVMLWQKCCGRDFSFFLIATSACCLVAWPTNRLVCASGERKCYLIGQLVLFHCGRETGWFFESHFELSPSYFTTASFLCLHTLIHLLCTPSSL